jgi:peptidoglycan/xylan/chitin deacetylase (PgdA/CDA1 family)
MKALLLLIAATSFVVAQRPNRTVAVTIDDLPVVTSNQTPENRLAITRKLLGHVRKAKVPAVGFVNENKLYSGDKRNSEQIDLLRLWLDAGLELGNHTYSHRSLNRIDREEYQADLTRGETITKELLAARGKKIRYFRHPYLQTGRTMEIKNAFHAFLERGGYTIAPVTIDNGDYIFAAAYEKAAAQGDKELAEQVGEAYVPYMEKKLEYWERQSVKLFGREVAQTLLMHANAINADYFDDLAKMFKRRGYEFVDLETALKDDAYRLPDKFLGGAGISWLHRWALDRGRENVLPDEPMVPEFVLKLSGFTSE